MFRAADASAVVLVHFILRRESTVLLTVITTGTAQDDAAAVSGTRYILTAFWRRSVPRQRPAISEMASSRRSGLRPSTSQAPAACREGTGTRSRTSDGERSRMGRWK